MELTLRGIQINQPSPPPKKRNKHRKTHSQTHGRCMIAFQNLVADIDQCLLITKGPKALVDTADEKQREGARRRGMLQMEIDAHSSQRAQLQMCR